MKIINTRDTAAQIEAARNGSEPDTAAIIARFMPTIRRISRRAVSPGLDFDDAVQEGIIGLFSAIQTWRPGASAAFPTYATVCIHNAILTAKRTAGRKKHTPLNQSVPYTENESIPGPEEAADAREQVDITLQKARTLLSPMEKDVLRMTLDGASQKQIARKLGKSPKSVENALARARTKLR